MRTEVFLLIFQWPGNLFLPEDIEYIRQRDLFFFFKFLFIDLRETERDINLLFHLFIRSLADFCMCPDWGQNMQPWRTLTNWAPSQVHTFKFFIKTPKLRITQKLRKITITHFLLRSLQPLICISFPHSDPFDSFYVDCFVHLRSSLHHVCCP